MCHQKTTNKYIFFLLLSILMVSFLVNSPFELSVLDSLFSLFKSDFEFSVFVAPSDLDDITSLLASGVALLSSLSSSIVLVAGATNVIWKAEKCTKS